jgi:hydroxymethylpyrimidine kinase/phosphomethylpyrimidine kinase/thiamine-phosphate diphosphorylase
MNANPPILWTIAGSDSGGGAGLQADLQVFRAFGLHGCSITTAITAQNTLGVQHIAPLSPTLIQAQWKSLQQDLPPTCIKTGMLGDAVETIADLLDTLPNTPLICDPVLRSTSGTTLLEPHQLQTLLQRILPRVTLITPNLPEAARLTGLAEATPRAYADALLQLGAPAVLIKGGHATGNICSDFYTDAHTHFQLQSPRLDTPATHGTGCLLAAAIAAALANKQSLRNAVITAKTYLNQNLHEAQTIGKGHGPLPFPTPCNAPQYQPNIC